MQHVSVKGLEVSHNPVQNRFQAIRDSLDALDPTQFTFCSLHQCYENLGRLEKKKLKAKSIYKENCETFPFLNSLFPWCGGTSYLKDEYRLLCQEIDTKLSHNIHFIDVKAKEIFAGHRDSDDPFEVLAAFNRGCGFPSARVLFKKRLIELYRQIYRYAREGRYPLDQLRQGVKAASSVIPDHMLLTKVSSGEHEFTFHDLILVSQFGSIREKYSGRLPIHIDLDVHPLILENLYELYEEGRIPRFKGFEEAGALKFLQVCHDLKLSSSAIQEGLFLLDEKSRRFQVSVYGTRIKVVCRGHFQREGLKDIIPLDLARPVRFLDINDTDVALTWDVIDDLTANFPYLRELHCTPYSTASVEDWFRLFDKPKLRVIVFDFSEYHEEYLPNLLKAIETHPDPPKIYMKGGVNVPLKIISRIIGRNILTPDCDPNPQ